MVGRYVLVSTDTSNKTIIQGPISWDGVTPFDLPDGQTIVLESDALAAGYTYPAPDPVITNASNLRVKAQTALTSNVAYLAIPSPTQAQAIAQVAALTRQIDALIRLATGLLNDTGGT